MSVASSTNIPLTPADTYGSIVTGTIAGQTNMVNGTPVVSAQLVLAPGIWALSAYYGFGINNAFTGTINAFIASGGGTAPYVAELGQTDINAAGLANTYYEQGSVIINNNTGGSVIYSIVLLPTVTTGAGTLNTTGPPNPYSFTAVFLG
jgi:hypothetical protein